MNEQRYDPDDALDAVLRLLRRINAQAAERRQR